jgi:hypothetical protein
VGNIKPGESGTVDAMVTGASPTMDDGTIRVIISYEDINGETSTQEETINLFVTEDIPEDFERVIPEDDIVEASPLDKIKLPGAILIGILGAAVVVFFIRKKKKEKEQKQDTDETI